MKEKFSERSYPRKGATDKMTIDLEQRAKEVLKIQERMGAISHKIVVLSGKGGVGKTTVAVGLAKTLAEQGKKVGILDTDIHGPNVALMLGLEGFMLGGEEGNIEPLVSEDGIKVVSMANLLPDSNTPIIWRGPAKLGAIRQLIADVNWGKLDFLIVDSPPGTGDEPLTVAQTIPAIDGAVIVTTPQNVALLDCRKCINFARQLKIPILGVIENMSVLKCPHCGGDIDLFRSGGGLKVTKQMKTPFLGSIPMEPSAVVDADMGKLFSTNSVQIKKAFSEVVKNILTQLAEAKK
jgi:Mrp family chromosome partitioning ATPase